MNGHRLIYSNIKLVVLNDGSLWAETYRGIVIGAEYIGARRRYDYYRYVYEGSPSEQRLFKYPYIMKADYG